jgi:predicted nucleic-acid-binding Zn-ribbon protein
MKKSFCTKCGHRGFTLVEQKDRDILICKKCKNVIIYNKQRSDVNGS